MPISGLGWKRYLERTNCEGVGETDQRRFAPDEFARFRNNGLLYREP
jgi:hypothetical protein